MENELKAGDTVVDLSGLTRTASICSGSVAASVATTMAVGWSFGRFGLSLLVGGVVGAMVGTAAGKMLYRNAKQHVTVVRAGPQALPSTFRAGLGGASFMGLSAGVVSFLLWGRVDAALVAAGSAVFAGLAVATLAALV